MAKKSAAGSGTIRKRPDGRWEGRFIAGINPGTGAYIRRSVYGKTQKEVREKLTLATAAVDAGSYLKPEKLTVGKWLDRWERSYLPKKSQNTRTTYKRQIQNHIKPAFGAVQLQVLSPEMVQDFYNRLADTMAPKSVKLIHVVLHEAMKEAVSLGYLHRNPADGRTLPPITNKKIKPLDDAAISRFLAAIKGHRFEALFSLAVLTGMRQGELLGLQWSGVDFDAGTITIETQLQNETLCPPKGGKIRTITPAPTVMNILKRHKAAQAAARLYAGELWQGTDFVFTDEQGRHLTRCTVRKDYKAIVSGIGFPDARFHDLRHSYAVASIRAGDDIKTIQENLGHASATITLDIYAHATDQMKRDSAARMEQFIRKISALG